MNASFRKGDMVYVPSQSRLYQFDEGVTVKYLDLNKPKNLLVIGKTEDYYKVLHAGQHWHVKMSGVYQTRGENVSQPY